MAVVGMAVSLGVDFYMTLVSKWNDIVGIYHWLFCLVIIGVVIVIGRVGIFC